LTCYMPWKMLKRRGGKSHSFLTSALEGGECSTSCLGHTYPGEWTPSTHCTGGWVGLRAGWVQRIEEKSSATAGDQTLVAQSIASHYTDWPTQLTRSCVHIVIKGKIYAPPGIKPQSSSP
jgi:hypothetical protein